MRRAPLVLTLAALLLASASVLLSVVLFTRTTGEVRERRNQTCILFERQHLTEVKRLRATYDFLDKVPRAEKRTALNQAIAAQLPELEERVRSIAAPPYCDKPGVGLPEPNPEIPEHSG